MILFIIFAVNFIFACILLLLIRAGYIYSDYGVFAMMVFLPYLGELIVLGIHIHTKLKLNGRSSREIIRGKEDKENNETGFFLDDDRDSSIPLEDALIVNSGRERQKVLRDAILSGTNDRSAVLLRASKNADSEIVHFATTAMTHAENEYEKEISNIEIEVRKANDDAERLTALDKEIMVLTKLINNTEEDSGILLDRQKKLISILKKRILINPTIEYLNMLSKLFLDIKDMESALRYIKRANLLFPNDPDTWILRFRYYFLLKDRKGMDMMITRYKNGHSKNARIDKIINFWER